MTVTHGVTVGLEISGSQGCGCTLEYEFETTKQIGWKWDALQTYVIKDLSRRQEQCLDMHPAVVTDHVVWRTQSKGQSALQRVLIDHGPRVTQ